MSRPKPSPDPPPPPELLGLLDDAVASPYDDAPRMILGDWLAERDDPRAALVRLVPALCATPRRDGPHPELPSLVWRAPHGGWPRSSLGQWPPLTRPLPPGRSRLGRERRAPWRGLHHLGRLLGVALFRELLALPEEADARVALGPFVARCELYDCGLIDARRRDDGKVTGPGSLAALVGGGLHPLLCRAAWRCRAGPFGGFVALACEVMVCRYGVMQALGGASPPDQVETWLRERMRLRGPLYGRFLDVAREFVRIAPWREAREAWERRVR